ncbi:hypothetical protein ACFTQ7_13090 [Lysinibacillus sp. NPDC056959]|uniref:hypothetical protein n=1 Tax=Lysinibacillus sp. NPDC056959 TaxID=3345981 RepID=UPI003643735D
MLKILITLKWMIAISIIGIGITIIFTSFYFLQDYQYYRWIKWAGFILFFAGIILTPFAKESNKGNVKN